MTEKKNIIFIEEISEEDLPSEIEKDLVPTELPPLEPSLDENSEIIENPEINEDIYPSNNITLKDFINRIKSQIEKDDPIIKNIADKELLVMGLEELDSLIGHDKVKADVIDQVVYAI